MMFVISFLTVICSSYFICSILKSDKFGNNVIFYILTAISQIIITFEALSLIKQVNPNGVLIFNFAVLIVSFVFWNLFKRPAIAISNLGNFKKKFNFALKKDKILIILFLAFIFSGLVSLFLALIAPTNSGDSLSYHLARIGFWVQQGSLNHFETSSIRQLVFPINSEILILWPMVFFKRDYLAQMPEFLSYLGCLFVLYNFMAYQKISTRRILWTFFILASLPAVILESMSCQTNLIMAFLLISSLYLFIFGVRENDKKSLIFSAVSYGIALGIKSTAFLFIPAFAVVFLLFSVYELKRNFYKPLLVFIFSVIPAFILFSSYNYILNYIDFGNPFSPASFMQQHAPGFTIKGFIANLIKYFIMLFDFSGIPAANALNPFFMGIKDGIFHFLGIKTTDGLAFVDLPEINTFVQESYSMFGVLGFILFLPLVLKSCLTKIRFSKKRSSIIALTALFFIVFYFTISAAMGFCLWFNRFFLTAVVLSSSVFIFSYTRKNTIWKTLIAFIAIFNFLVIPVSDISKPFSPIILALRNCSAGELRHELRLRSEINISEKQMTYDLTKYLGKNVPNNSQIAFVPKTEECFYQFFEENPTWKFYLLRYDLLFKRKNYNDYDFIILPGKKQDMEVPFKGKIKYNYTIRGKKIIYNHKNPNDPVIVYYDNNAIPVDSGIPSAMSTSIDFSDIPNNFKLIKIFNILYAVPPDYKETYNYYLYKKIN